MNSHSSSVSCTHVTQEDLPVQPPPRGRIPQIVHAPICAARSAETTMGGPQRPSTAGSVGDQGRQFRFIRDGERDICAPTATDWSAIGLHGEVTVREKPDVERDQRERFTASSVRPAERLRDRDIDRQSTYFQVAAHGRMLSRELPQSAATGSRDRQSDHDSIRDLGARLEKTEPESPTTTDPVVGIGVPACSPNIRRKRPTSSPGPHLRDGRTIRRPAVPGCAAVAALAALAALAAGRAAPAGRMAYRVYAEQVGARPISPGGDTDLDCALVYACLLYLTDHQESAPVLAAARRRRRQPGRRPTTAPAPPGPRRDRRSVALVPPAHPRRTSSSSHGPSDSSSRSSSCG